MLPSRSCCHGADRYRDPQGPTQRQADQVDRWRWPVPAAESDRLALWRFDYRRPVTKQRNTLSLGTYPEVPLRGYKDKAGNDVAGARDLREQARTLLAQGIDPGEHRKARNAASKDRAANSFEVVAREWFAKQRANWVQSHADKILLRLENDVFPWLGKRPIAEITAKELLNTINRIVDRGAVESAHRALQNCGQVFRYAIVTGRAERNPAADLRGALPPVKQTPRAAIIEPKAIGGLCGPSTPTKAPLPPSAR